MCVLRSQEEESLRAAIALSKQETEQDEEEGEGEEEDTPTTNGGDLLLDFGSTGKLVTLYVMFVLTLTMLFPHTC